MRVLLDIFEKKTNLKLLSFNSDERELIENNVTNHLMSELRWYGDYKTRIKYARDKTRKALAKINLIREARACLDASSVRVGDIMYVNNKKLVVSVVFDDRFQVSDGGSLYVYGDGAISFSCGTLEDVCAFESIKLKYIGLEQIDVWSFILGVGANRGIHFKISTNVWECESC